MDALTLQEKSGLMNDLAAIAHVLVPTAEEQQIAELVDDNIAYASIKVKRGEWTEELAAIHVSIAVNAAASSYASLRYIKEQAAREAIVSFLRSIIKILNSRIGFNLLPIL